MQGSGLDPPVSVPQKPDDTEYLASLKTDEKELFDKYKDIMEKADEDKLVEYVKSGEIKPDQKDK